MTSRFESSPLYWHGGPFEPDIDAQYPLQSAAAARNILREFLDECHRYYFAFWNGIFGLSVLRTRYEQVFDPAHRDNRFSAGSGPPGTAQSPGRSVTAAMTQGDFLDAMQQGGEFEVQHCKALLVLIYHLWDEQYRPAIAQAIGVCYKQVISDLMGDLRLVRNLIIHDNSIVPDGFSNRLKFLPAIWDVNSGDLNVTSPMLGSFMEQLNAIRLNILESCPDRDCNH